MTNIEMWLFLLFYAGIMACVAWAASLVAYELSQWRPIIRAYLEARCAERPMRVATDNPDDLKPGRAFAPEYEDEPE